MIDDLQMYLELVRHEPFSWGKHDCALFAAKAVDAMHGSDWAKIVARHGCKSARDFRRMQRDGATLKSLTVAELGEPLPGGVLLRGDVVLVNAGRGDTLGIAVPPVVLVASDIGFVPLPMSAALLAWRAR